MNIVSGIMIVIASHTKPSEPAAMLTRMARLKSRSLMGRP